MDDVRKTRRQRKVERARYFAMRYRAQATEALDQGNHKVVPRLVEKYNYWKQMYQDRLEGRRIP